MTIKIAPKEWLKSNHHHHHHQKTHVLSLKDLQERYGVETTNCGGIGGLSSTRAKELLKKYGLNQIEVSYARMAKAILLGLVDKFSLILWTCIVLSAVLYQPLGGSNPDPRNLINVAMTLFCFLVKSILIGVQEVKLMRVMRSLQSVNKTLVSVLRDSKWQKIAAADLVVGDVIEIVPNQRVPADIRLTFVKSLRLDKSTVTGSK